MTIIQGPETISIPDPFWIEHREQIERTRLAIEAPKTKVGEGEAKSVYNNPIFLVYDRLQPIFGSLVALIEYDEIGQDVGEVFFSDPVSQRIVLKALGMLVEDRIKSPYPPEEKKKFEDYRPFFEGLLTRLNEFDQQIQSGQPPRNFVNSLVMIFSQETLKLKGVENLPVKTDKIRSDIAAYLPELREAEGGSIFSEIKGQIENALSIMPGSPGH